MTHALVTGATSGIGRAIALALHGAGYAVTAVGRNRDALNALSAAATGLQTLCLDLSDRASLTAALQGQRVDVLVNNAGIMPPPGPFEHSDDAATDRTLATNLQSVLVLTRLVLPQMTARGSGHIVFTGSTAGHAPSANFAVYGATKAAISAFAASLRAEVSAHGLRVTELVPGRVETGLYEAVLSDAARQAMYRDGAALQPSDIAEALLAVLRLPPRADVARLDIVPTRPVPPIALK